MADGDDSEDKARLIEVEVLEDSAPSCSQCTC